MPISDNVPGTRPLVLVIGARSALGALVADAFRRHGWAVRQSSRSPIPPPDFQYVDLTDPATLRPLSTEWTRSSRRSRTRRSPLNRRGVLLNLSAGPATALRSLRRKARRAEGTVVMNAGIAPGVTNLHPYVAEELIRQREQELRRSARRYTPPRQLRRWHGSARYRTGWLLIEIGLALAQGSGDA